MQITINDEVYTLDGLVKAYKQQLETMEQAVDDRLILALTARLQEDHVIKRLICNELSYNHGMRTSIADLLVEQGNFADMIVDRLQNRLMDILEDRVREMFHRTADAWWDRRFSEIRSMVASQVSSDDAAAIRREVNLKAMLQVFLGDSIKETVTDAVKEEVTGRITALQAKPTVVVERYQAPQEGLNPLPDLSEEERRQLLEDL